MFNEYRVSAGEDEEVLKLDSDDGWYNNVNVPGATELYTEKYTQRKFHVMYILSQLKKHSSTHSILWRDKHQKNDCLWGAGFGEKEKRKILFLIINSVE